MNVGLVLLLLVALFMLVPGGYWVVKPELPGWVRRWMIWPLRSTSPRVLRLQGWAGVGVGLAWLCLAVADVSASPLILLAVPFLVLGAIAWTVSVVLSFREAATPARA